jgi:hypothetical protein
MRSALYSFTLIVIGIGCSGLSNPSRGGGDDLVSHLPAPKDFSEDGVDSVQPTGVRDTDMALL